MGASSLVAVALNRILFTIQTMVQHYRVSSIRSSSSMRRRNIERKRQNLSVSFQNRACWLLVFLLASTNPNVVQAQEGTEEFSPPLFNFDDLPACTLSTGELVRADSDTPVEPCILFDIQPTRSTAVNTNTTSIITVIGVFDAQSGDHRDGAVMAVEAMNADNDGKGASIGYFQDHYVQFRFVAAIPGNSKQIATPAGYEEAHQRMLESLLVDLKPQYVLGTASFHASMEKDLASKYQTILLAQVGPQSFYEAANEHVFGIHIPSESYGIPAFQALRFASSSLPTSVEQLSSPSQPRLKIVYRDRSEFFYSTCRHVYDRAVSEGFGNNTLAIEYNPEADHDGDGVLNQDDEDFVRDLADQACTPDEVDQGVAIWGCFLTDIETNIFLQHLGETSCRPSSLWLTVASWNWAYNFPELVPYTQSGAQWHADMVYADEYYNSGLEMIHALQTRFQHPNLPAYGVLSSYHGIYLMYHNIRSYFKGKDVPNVELSFQEQYEEIRRNLLDLSVPKSLYGPTSFDEHRRNIGRGSAGLQWQLTSNSNVQATTPRVEMLLVAPIDQASASVAYPAPVAQVCRAGEFVNRTLLASDPSLLVNKCDRCPVDSISTEDNIDVACQVCISGTSTEGADGAVICIEHEENLITEPLKGFGYALMSLVFFTALGCIGWTFYQRDNPVVRLSQPVFLVLIAVGSIISSSSIIPLSLDAGAFEDETSSNRACMALPWIYTTGWMLQYGCISFKSYRMYVLLKAQKQLRRVAIKTERMLVYVGLLMLLNVIVLIPWTILDPLVWHRTEQGTSIDSQNGVLTFESYGSCSCDNFFLWIGPLLGLQFAVMIFTNFILWKIRNVSDRYQESRYFIMASLYIFEIIVVGIPILVAVGDSVEASYIVLVCIVGVSDLGTLLMIFVPKIMFARQGLPEGLSVGESLFGVRRQSSVAIDNIRKKALASGSMYLQSRSFDVDDDGFDQTAPSNSRVHQECSTSPSPMPEPMSSDAKTRESSNVANSSKQTKKDSQDESASEYQEE